MEVSVAQWLVSEEGRAHLQRAMGFDDPSSLRAATALRSELDPDRAAAVLGMVSLRRAARVKLGTLADKLFLARDGLEQATRWDVARWRADRIAGLGVHTVADLGCGLGIDALACLAAGLSVMCVERDPVTAVLARANLEVGMSLSGRRCVEKGEMALKPAAIQGSERATSPFSLHGQGSDVEWVETGVQITESGTALTAVWRSSEVEKDAPPQGATVVKAAIEDIDLAAWLSDPATAIFMDPARRTSRGRSWDVADLSPSWATVTALMGETVGPFVAKLGPGFPRRLLPNNADVTWVSHRGDLVETTLWKTPESAGLRQAVLLRSRTDSTYWSVGRADDVDGDVSASGGSGGDDVAARTVAEVDDRSSARAESAGEGQIRGVDTLTSTGAPIPVGPVLQYIYEPDPAVIRSGGIGDLAQLIGGHAVADSIAYLTSDEYLPIPFACAFEVMEYFAYSEKNLRAWAREHEIGIMEIKVRGLDVDPAILRKRLSLKGPNNITVILTPTTDGTQAFIVRRVAQEQATR